MGADVKFKIGGSLDKSVDVALSEFSKRIDKAARRMADVMGQAQKMVADTVKKTNREILSDEEKLEREIARIDKGLTNSKEIELRKQLDSKRRAMREAVNAERDAARTSQREMERFAARTSYRATRFIFPRPEGAIGYAKRVGTDYIRGLGISFDLGSSVARNVANQTLSTRLSNQGWVEGEGRFQDRISAKAIRDNSQGVANKYGFTEHEVTSATQAYTNLTGDLKTAIPLMDKLALLSKATGTDLSDMANAAADMGVQLKDTPDKAEKLQKILGIAAMQGKTGALEMFQLAPMMPRIVSLAGQFKGDSGDNMAQLLAATQIIRRYGGGGSAPQSATALAGAVGALNKGGGKAFKKYGIDVADKQGNLRSLQDIVIESIHASKNQDGSFNRKKFFDMWNAVRGGKLATGLLKVDRDAANGMVGTKAGDAAIRAEFAKFTRTMSVDAQKKMAEEASNTPEAKAQKFQNQLDKIAESLSDRILPKLEELAPTALAAVTTISNKLTWAIDHIGATAGIIIGAAVLRAGLESAFRTGLERLTGVGNFGPRETGGALQGLKYTGAGFTQGGGFTAAGAIGAAGMGAAIGIPLAMGIYQGGTTRFEEKNKDLSDTMKDLNTASGPELAEKLLAARQKVKDEKGSFWGGAANMFGIGNDAEVKGLENLITRKQAELDKDPTGKLAAKANKPFTPQELAVANAQALAGQTLNVNVMNADMLKGGAGSPAKVGADGREQPPGHR